MNEDEFETLVKAIEAAKHETLAAIEGRRQQDSVTGTQVIEELKGIKAIVMWLKARWERFTRSGTWPGDSK